GRNTETKQSADLEALTRDPATGRLWAAFEAINEIARYEPDFSGVVRVRPVAMRNWPGNAGAEAMVRLRDGRFIVLAEASPHWFAAGSPGLLFPGDPVEGSQPVGFRFATPAGFRP